jgi:hypothetical protein
MSGSFIPQILKFAPTSASGVPSPSKSPLGRSGKLNSFTSSIPFANPFPCCVCRASHSTVHRAIVWPSRPEIMRPG